MGSLIRHITVDCRDHYALMQFWREALEDYHDHPEDPNKPEDEQSGLVGPPGSPWLLFVPVPEDKSVKNRLHLDIAPLDRTRDEEVDRLVTLGAQVVGDHRRAERQRLGGHDRPRGQRVLRRAQRRGDRREPAVHRSHDRRHGVVGRDYARRSNTSQPPWNSCALQENPHRSAVATPSAARSSRVSVRTWP